jgi:hypothetical protein
MKTTPHKTEVTNSTPAPSFPSPSLNANMSKKKKKNHSMEWKEILSPSSSWPTILVLQNLSGQVSNAFSHIGLNVE